MSVARKKLDWEEQARLSLDPERSRRVHSKHASSRRSLQYVWGVLCHGVSGKVFRYLGNQVLV